MRQQVTALKKERPRPPLEDTERAFWVALRGSWPAWASRLLIVHADTVARWHRDRFRRYWAKISQRRHPGRPRIDAEIRRLVRTMAQDGWGAPRIHAELTGNCTARQVDIEGAWDFYMNLSRIDLSEIEWHDLDIPGERLNFSSVAFGSSNLKGVMLPGAFMFQAKLGGAELSDAYMPGAMLDSCSANSAVFVNANLQSSNFDNAQVNAADFTSAMLTRATFRGADLRGAKLCGAHLRDVDFERANLSRADMTQCSGLTQATLDRAVATCGNPPVLEGASDHETRQPLVWRGLEPAPGSGIGRPSVEHRILPNAVDRYPLWTP